MKKTQFLLSATAFFLTTAGVVAKKASTNGLPHVVGYTTLGVCHRFGNLLVTTVKRTTTTNTARTAAGNQTFYTVRAPHGAPTVCGKKTYTRIFN